MKTSIKTETFISNCQQKVQKVLENDYIKQLKADGKKRSSPHNFPITI